MNCGRLTWCVGKSGRSLGPVRRSRLRITSGDLAGWHDAGLPLGPRPQPVAGEVVLAQQHDQVVVKIRQSLEMPVGIAIVVVLDPHAPAATRIIGVILATEDAPDLEFLVWAFRLMAGASCTARLKPCT